MAIVGIALRPDSRAELSELARELQSWIVDQQHDLVCEPVAAQVLGIKEIVTIADLARECDVVVVIGGDGTLINVARHIIASSPMMLGVNFGKVGFLTELQPHELLPVLAGTLAGEMPCEERLLARVILTRAGKDVYFSQVVNEAVVQKGARDRILDLEIKANTTEVMELRGDGVIVSTPTGSTAYSLSAGGSIVHPALKALLVTPLNTHSLASRSLVLPDTTRISIKIPQYDGEVYLVVDGQDSTQVQSGDMITVTVAKARLRLVRSPSRGYLAVLREKLGWRGRAVFQGSSDSVD